MFGVFIWARGSPSKILSFSIFLLKRYNFPIFECIDLLDVLIKANNSIAAENGPDAAVAPAHRNAANDLA
jgi:hypothetical protein